MAFLCVCVGGWLTGYGEQHGDGSEGPGEALAAHEDGAVLLRQLTHQAEQTALQHGTKRCGQEARVHYCQPLVPLLTHTGTLTYS